MIAESDACAALPRILNLVILEAEIVQGLLNRGTQCLGLASIGHFRRILSEQGIFFGVEFLPLRTNFLLLPLAGNGKLLLGGLHFRFCELEALIPKGVFLRQFFLVCPRPNVGKLAHHLGIHRRDHLRQCLLVLRSYLFRLLALRFVLLALLGGLLLATGEGTLSILRLSGKIFLRLTREGLEAFLFFLWP